MADIMKTPHCRLTTDMERLLFAQGRYNIFDVSGDYHWRRSKGSRSIKNAEWHRKRGIFLKAKAHFWAKVAAYYSARIEGADLFIIRYL